MENAGSGNGEDEEGDAEHVVADVPLAPTQPENTNQVSAENEAPRGEAHQVQVCSNYIRTGKFNTVNLPNICNHPKLFIYSEVKQMVVN